MGQHHQPLRPQQHPAWQRTTIRRLAYDPNSAKSVYYNSMETFTKNQYLVDKL